MKKVLLVILVALMAISCNEQENVTPKVTIAEQATEMVCPVKITIIGDAARVAVMVKVVKSINTAGLEIDPQPQDKPVFVDGKVGFFINGDFVPFSNEILKTAQAATNSNSSVVGNELVGETLCISQAMTFQDAYNKAAAQCSEQVVCSGDGNLICDSTISVDDVIVDYGPLGGLPSWLQWLLALLLLALVIYLLYLLFRDNDTTNNTSETTSKTCLACKEQGTCCKECGKSQRLKDSAKAFVDSSKSKDVELKFKEDGCDVTLKTIK